MSKLVLLAGPPVEAKEKAQEEEAAKEEAIEMEKTFDIPSLPVHLQLLHQLFKVNLDILTRNTQDTCVIHM